MKVLEMTDNISWSMIHDILHESHRLNRERGICMTYASLTADELKDKFREDTRVFVAFDSDRPIGCAAIQKRHDTLWCGAGDYGYLCLAAVLPSYQGKGIYQVLQNKRLDAALAQGIDKVIFDTHERNKKVIKIALKNDFHPVKLRHYGDHYSVVFVKWLKRSPYPHFYCLIRYVLSYIHVKLLFLFA